MSPGVRDPQSGAAHARVPGKIALVGLRGGGKTTVGALLARELVRPFVDLDLELERAFAAEHPSEAAARPLRAGEILAREGEPAFRALESRVLAEVLARVHPLVLACGGGVVLDPVNRQRLRETAWVVWLDAPDEELARRLAADPTPRPALTDAGRRAGAASVDELRLVREQRSAAYEAASSLRIRTEGLTPEQVASILRGGLGLTQA